MEKINVIEAKIEQNRVSSLDYLKGFMAVSIMIYHYSGWTFGAINATSILGKLGIYAVSMFYIISGLTLYLVYSKSMTTNYKSILSFGIRRIFRILPLLWIATILQVVLNHKMGFKVPDYKTIMLNLSGLFAFFKPTAYIGTGVWSIGNELVFYSLFPLFILIAKENKYLFYFFCSFVFLIGLYFSFYVFTTKDTLGNQWADYINPFNQFFLFIGGILIGYIFKEKQNNNKIILIRSLLVISILFFIFYHVFGDQIYIVTGWNRIVYVTLCFIISTCVYLDNYNLNQLFNKFCVFLGEASYSIYLLHPIVYYTVDLNKPKFFDFTKLHIFIISLPLTLILSFLVYNKIEKNFIRIGKKLTLKLIAI
ncbi:acyltransferase [Candidatus Desantisbacteria bacterium]|nr:acyltransferase [Candidatus Desantisbacteria bacterium]